MPPTAQPSVHSLIMSGPALPVLPALPAPVPGNVPLACLGLPRPPVTLAAPIKVEQLPTSTAAIPPGCFPSLQAASSQIAHSACNHLQPSAPSTLPSALPHVPPPAAPTVVEHPAPLQPTAHATLLPSPALVLEPLDLLHGSGFNGCIGHRCCFLRCATLLSFLACQSLSGRPKARSYPAASYGYPQSVCATTRRNRIIYRLA